MQSSENFNFQEVQDKLSTTGIGFESREEGDGGKIYRTEHSPELFCDQQLWFNYGVLDSPRYDILTPQLETTLKEIDERQNYYIQNAGQTKKPKKKDQFSSTSLHLLKNYGLKRMSSERIVKPVLNTPKLEVESQRFSTEDVMRIAAERFIRSVTESIDVISMLDNPFDISFSGLSDEVVRKLELAQLLLASAEKVSNQQYDRAKLLLNQCELLSSSTGNAVERAVHYFSKALQERIDRETEKMISQTLEKPQSIFNIDDSIKGPAAYYLACYQEVPFSQIAHFAGIQAILENVKNAKKIHLIDFEIRVGIQWPGLMQALVSQSGGPIKLLKITAISTNSKQVIEETGKRLTNFAQSINLPFAFNMVVVSDLSEINENLFELGYDETVVVYCEYLLRRLIPWPGRLDSMMKVIRRLNPRILVVQEPELNSTSPVFVNRFVEALFYFSAYFDCLETCMRDDPSRMVIESLHFGEGIRNIVAAEGEARITRNAKLSVWKVFFAHFRMVEIRLSTSLCQAKLIADKFPCGNACTLDMDGKSLLIGWKGTPMHSLSAWKFI